MQSRAMLWVIFVCATEASRVTLQVPPLEVEKEFELDPCFDMIAQISSTAIERMGAAQGCGVDVGEFQFGEQGGYEVSEQGKEQICSEACSEIQDLGKPLLDIEEAREACEKHPEQLAMAIPAHEIAVALQREWLSCQQGEDEVDEELSPTVVPAKIPPTAMPIEFTDDFYAQAIAGAQVSQVSPTDAKTPAKPGRGEEGWVDIVDLGGNVVLGCGPRTPEFRAHMFALLLDARASAEQAVELFLIHNIGTNFTYDPQWKQMAKNTYTKLMSCLASCVSVFSKFSECASQDVKCSDKGEMDSCKSKSYRDPLALWVRSSSACSKSSTWLQKVRPNGMIGTRSQAYMPCKDIYHSRDKAKSWQNALADAMLGKYRIKVAKQGDFTALDCKKSWCGKVHTLLDSMSEPTFASCSNACYTKA